MIGYTVFPEAARERHPGQVPKRRRGGMFRDHIRGDPFHQTSEPRFDPEIDPAQRAPKFTMERYWSEEKPIMRSSQIAVDLGLPPRRQKDIERIVKNHANQNEIKFRQGVMSQLMQQKVEPILRSKIMNRALSYYRTKSGNKKRYMQQKVWKSKAVDRPHPPGRPSPDDPDLEDDRHTDLPIDIAHNEVKRRKLRTVAQDAKNVSSMHALEEPRPKTGPRSEAREGDNPSTTDFADLHNDRQEERGRKRYVITPSDVVHLPNPVEGLKKPDRTFDAVNKAGDRDGHLKKLVSQMVQDAGGEGCSIENLAPLVHRYGTKEIANAIRSLGSYHVDKGRIHVCKSVSPRYVIRDTSMPLSEPLYKQEGGAMAPAPAAGAGMAVAHGTSADGRAVGGAGGGSTGSPPGTRKVWGTRIVERTVDGKWKVVGHIAGLEGEKVPSKRHKLHGRRQDMVREHGEIQTDHLTQEQAQHLIDQLKQEKNEGGAGDGRDKK